MRFIELILFACVPVGVKRVGIGKMALAREPTSHARVTSGRLPDSGLTDSSGAAMSTITGK